MITIKNLVFRYPHSDFELNLNRLQVAAGERLAIVGASGSGKTTLLDVIAGIRTPASGSVRVDETDLFQLTARDLRSFRSRRIGLIFQGFELFDYLSVRDNILLPYRLNPALKSADDPEPRLGSLTLGMGIHNRLDRTPGELSQGERQRVAICRALINAPDLILADEPTGNLDPDNKQRALRMLLDQASLHAATLVMVTHDHDLLTPFDRVLDMRTLHQASR